MHRYQREVGFLRADAVEEAEDQGIAAARKRLRQDGAGQIKSHTQRVKRFALFERYCLEKHPDHEWSKWLLGLQVDGAEPIDEGTLHERQQQRITFKAPTEGLVRACRTSVPHCLFPPHELFVVCVYLSGHCIWAESARCREF